MVRIYISLMLKTPLSVLLSLPLKYMHTSVETIDLEALREGSRLLAHYLSELDAGWEDDLWI